MSFSDFLDIEDKKKIEATYAGKAKSRKNTNDYREVADQYGGGLQGAIGEDKNRGYLGEFGAGFAQNALSTIAGQMDAGRIIANTDGSWAKAVKDYAEQFDPNIEYTWQDRVPFLNDVPYYTDPRGLGRDLGGAAGSMAVLGAESFLPVPGDGAITKLAGGAGTKVLSKSAMQALEKEAAKKGVAETAQKLAGELIMREAKSKPLEIISNAGSAGAEVADQGIDKQREVFLKTALAEIPGAILDVGLGTRSTLQALQGAGASRGLGVLGSGLSNTFEEGYQQQTPRYAKGEIGFSDIYNPFGWDEEAWNAASVGAITGFVPAAGGAVIGTYADRAKAKAQAQAQPTSQVQEEQQVQEQPTSQVQEQVQDLSNAQGADYEAMLDSSKPQDQIEQETFDRIMREQYGVEPTKTTYPQYGRAEAKDRGLRISPKTNQYARDVDAKKQRQQISSVTHDADNLLLQAALEVPTMAKPQRGLTVVNSGEVGSPANNRQDFADAPATEGRYLRNYEQELVDKYVGNPKLFEHDYFSAMNAVKYAFMKGEIDQKGAEVLTANLQGLYEKTRQAIRNNGVIRQNGVLHARPIKDVLSGVRQSRKAGKGKQDVKLTNRFESGSKPTVQAPYYVQNAVRDIQDAKKAKAEAERKAKAFDELKAQVTEYVGETYADNRAEGIDAELQAAKEGRKELFAGLVKDLKEGMGQGVTRQYTDKETGEVVDVSDLKGKEETALSSASYNREWYSNNAPWYQNWYKSNGRKPTNAELYEIAENIYLGNDEYGSNLIPFDGSEEADEALAQNKANVEYYDNLIKIYDGLKVDAENTAQTAPAAPQQVQKQEGEEVVVEQVKEPVKETAASEVMLSNPYGATFNLNDEKNGIEIKFDTKPNDDVIKALKAAGYRWSKFAKLWWANQNNQRAMKVAEVLGFNSQKEVKLGNDTNERGDQNVVYNAEELHQEDNRRGDTQDDVRGTAESGRTGGSDGRGVVASEGARHRHDGGSGVSRSGDTVSGERTADESEGTKPRTDKTVTRSADTARGIDDSEAGQSDVDGRTAEEIVKPVADRQVNATEKQLKDITISNEKAGRKQKVAKSMPFLTSLQVNNVEFAHIRLDDTGKPGVMFTDGTGTGKTFSGLGIIQEALNAGKKNILIVSPSAQINDQWIQAAKSFFKDADGKPLKVYELENTRDAGKGVAITTYANMRDNKALFERDWDMILCDEAHNLMSSKSAEPSAALQQVRALTYHKRGMYDRARAIIPDTPEVSRLKEKIDQLDEQLRDLDKGLPKDTWERAWAVKHNTERRKELVEQIADLRKELDPLEKELRDQRKEKIDEWEKLTVSEKPKVVFLTATPFAYDKCIDYAEGYLFDYPEADGSGYNSGNGREQFMMEHFGYKMRYNKLTRPDAEVDNRVMEVQFHNWLRKEGALTGHELEVDADYNRGFILVGQGVGAKIDEGFDYLRQNNNKYSMLLAAIESNFDKRKQQYLLESIKAQQSIEIIKDYMKQGKKVVVFHDTNQPRAMENPFDIDVTQFALSDRDRITRELEMLKEERPDLFKLPMKNLKSPLEIFEKAFGDQALYFNGTVSKKVRNSNVAKFNSDTSGRNLIIVQKDAGNAGISLHDTTGKHQRALVILGIPTRPTYAIQIEGRIYRTGNKSNAIFRYLTTGTDMENYMFATTIAGRASTAENLAMGDKARGLRDSFVNAYAEVLDGTWERNLPGTDGEDVGGKETDRAVQTEISEFDRAKSLYYATQKKNARNKAAEGTDYFATPEPIGYKMVEWADVQPGESILEPSAGHGAISRFFSPNTKNTIIEPSGKLAAVAKMNTEEAKLIQSDFESHNTINKYDAITMNPPFGTAGKLAMDHVAKAFKHLRNNGRLIALVPRGKMDERFDNWYDSEEAKSAYLVAEVDLPNVTFKRAGTAVGTRILVIDKHETKQPLTNIASRHIDLSRFDDINEFFDALEDIEMPPREQYLYDGRNIGAIGDDRRFSLADSQVYQRTIEDILEEVEDAVGDVKSVEKVGDDVIVTLPNNKRFILKIEDEIIVSDEDARRANRDHGFSEDADGIIEGYWQSVERDDVDGVLAISRRSDKGVAYHEVMHMAMDLALTDRERAALIKDARKEAEAKGMLVDEVIAERYSKWVLARKEGKGTAFGKLFRKMQDFFYKLKALFTCMENAHNVMRKVESGEAFGRSNESTRKGVNKKAKLNVDMDYDADFTPVDLRNLADKIGDVRDTDVARAAVENYIIDNLVGTKINVNSLDEYLDYSFDYGDAHNIVHVARARSTSGKSNVASRTARNLTISNMEDVLKNSVLVEVAEPKKHTGTYANVEHEDNIKAVFRAVMPIIMPDGNVATLVITADSLEKPITNKNIHVSIYEISTRKTKNTASPHFGAFNGVQQVNPATYKLTEILWNVKGLDGQPYVDKTTGQLNIETDPAKRYPKGDMLFKRTTSSAKDRLRNAVVSTDPTSISKEVKEQGYKGWLKGKWNNFYRDWVDKNNSLHGLDEAFSMKLGRKLEDGEKIYDKVQMIPATAAGMSEALIEGDERHIEAINQRLKKKRLPWRVTLSMVLKTIDKTLMDKAYPNYLKDNGYKDWVDAFGHYLGYRRMAEMKRLHGDDYALPNGLTLQELDAEIKSAPAQFAKAAKMYYLFNDNLLTILEDAGIISEEVHKLLNDKYKEYCPLMRDFSDTAAADMFLNGLSNGGRGIGNVSTVLKRISTEGSERGIINPLETTIKSVAVMMNRAERNRVGQLAVEMGSKVDGIIKELPTPKGGDAVADPKNCIFTVMIDGKKVAYQTTQELYGPIVGYNLPAAGMVLGIAKNAARMLRTGATMSPSFIIRNLIRDTIFAGISSKNGFVPIVDSVQGAYALLNDPKLKAEFEAAGVTSFNFYNNADKAYKSLVELNGGKELDFKNPLTILKAIGKNLEGFSSFIESATRMGEFKRARGAGKSIDEAARAARELTLDFSRSGVYGENVNQVVPFFNACIQGGDKLYRLFRDNPVGTAVNIGKYIVLPSLILWAMNHDDEEYKELDPKVKLTHWIIGDVRIPKPQEAGVLFGSGIEAMLDTATGQDKEAMKNWALQALDGLSPNIIPTLFLPLVEWQANYSFFRDGKLVGYREEKLPDELQYKSSTSELSKGLGKLTGLSPIKIDNTVRGYAGTMGMLIWQAYDLTSLEKANLPEKKIIELPLIRDFFVNEYNKNRSVDEFYDMMNEAEKQHAGYGAKGNPAAYLKGIRATAKKISDLRKDSREVTDNPRMSPAAKRARIDRNEKHMKLLAERANKVFYKFVYK